MYGEFQPSSCSSKSQSSFVLIKMYGQGGHKLEINISLQQICANSKGGGGMIEGGVILREYGISKKLWVVNKLVLVKILLILVNKNEQSSHCMATLHDAQ